MGDSLSDKVREVAKRKYVQPAKQAGKSEVSIAVKNLLLNDLDRAEFPGNRVPLVCSAIRTRGFLRENGLEIIGIDGPASKTSPTVVVHYRIESENASEGQKTIEPHTQSPEDPAARAARLTNRLRGLLKDGRAAYGGGDGASRFPALTASDELPADRAKRLIGELRGLVQLDLSEYGGVEGFIRWVRGHDEDSR
jgi:hypothetical protein